MRCPEKRRNGWTLRGVSVCAAWLEGERTRHVTRCMLLVALSVARPVTNAEDGGSYGRQQKMGFNKIL